MKDERMDTASGYYRSHSRAGSGSAPVRWPRPPARSKGRYSVSGKTLTVAWNCYTKPESADINMLGGGFSLSGGSIFSAVGPFRSASQLVGSFEGGTSTYASAVGHTTVSKSLTFNADGTCRGSGVATVTSVTERSVAEIGGNSSHMGHWRLDGWLLTLTDAQGHSVRDIAYPVGDGKGKISLFQFSGIAYERKQSARHAEFDET